MAFGKGATVSGLDLTLLAIMLIGLWRGFVSGALQTALSLVSWLVALFVATKFAHYALPFLATSVETPIFRTVLAFLAVFLLTLGVLQFGVYLLNKLLSKLKLSWLNKLAGGALGAGVGLLKVLFVLSFSAPLLVNFEIWGRSPFAQALVPYAPLAKTLISEMAGNVYDEFNEELDNSKILQNR